LNQIKGKITLFENYLIKTLLTQTVEYIFEKIMGRGIAYFEENVIKSFYEFFNVS